MDEVSFWNHRGEHVRYELPPYSFEHWEIGEPLDNALWRSLLERAEKLLSAKVIRIDRRSMPPGINIVRSLVILVIDYR